jgi:hypothetical protein
MIAFDAVYDAMPNLFTTTNAPLGDTLRRELAMNALRALADADFKVEQRPRRDTHSDYEYTGTDYTRWSEEQGVEDFHTIAIANKVYIKIPGGEIQVGLISGSIVVWLDGQCHVLRDAAAVTQ